VGQAKWSPGGRYLAFVGALHGPSSDLYVFDLSTKEVRRLTDGPYQTLIMDWSPDGEWIVHQSVISFGTGAGMPVEAVWAVALDGSEIRHLYDANWEQTLAGWMDSSRFVVCEWGQPSGPMNILRASIEGGDPLLVYEGLLGIRFLKDFVFSVELGVAILNEVHSEVKEDSTTGIYLTSVQYVSEPQLVFPGIWRGISYWEERDLFLGIEESGEVVGFRGDGEVVFRTEVASGEGVTIPAPKNYRFAIYNDQGAWLYDWEGKLIQQVMNRSVEEFLWGPEGRTFYMLVGEDHTLYVGDAYSGGLMIVDTDVDNLMLIG
jgi:dipeptidyl aminopeptidase/acylaminoacyl peptidase